MRCEWESAFGRMAMNYDPYNGDAVYQIYTGKNAIKICTRCAELDRFKAVPKVRLLTTADVVKNLQQRDQQTQELCNAN